MAEEEQVKKILMALAVALVTVFIMPSLSLAQDCGQGRKTLYFLPIVQGMDEAQGGSQVVEDGRPLTIQSIETGEDGQRFIKKRKGQEPHVLNGYDFQYKQSNLSADQICATEVAFSVLFESGKSWETEGANDIRFRQYRVLEGLDFADDFNASGWTTRWHISPLGRLTSTITLAPGQPGFKIGFAEIRQDGDFERVVSTGTVRLWKDGEVVSQFSTLPVEARLVNYIQVFSAERDNQRTGIAIANPYFEDGIKVAIQLFNKNGKEIGKRDEVFSRYQYFGKFINELFPVVEQSEEWRQYRVFEGLMKITSSKPLPVSAIDGRVSRGMFLMSPVGSSGER